MKTYETHALGFPLIIINPKFKTRAGQKTLDINFEALSRIAFQAVIKKQGRLTGGEIKFIRGFLGLNQTEFADAMGLKGHSQVSKWEKNPEKLTRMSIHQEYVIRIKSLRIMDIRATNAVVDLFDKLKETKGAGKSIEIDAQDVA